MKLSQATLAEMSGLSTRYISHIETASKKASLSSLVNIANAVGISVDEILYGNQAAYKTDYQLDIVLLIEDCTPSEKRYLYLMISSVINILRDNGWQIIHGHLPSLMISTNFRASSVMYLDSTIYLISY